MLISEIDWCVNTGTNDAATFATIVQFSARSGSVNMPGITFKRILHCRQSQDCHATDRGAKRPMSIRPGIN